MYTIFCMYAELHYTVKESSWWIISGLFPKKKMMKEIIRLRKNNQYSMIQKQFGGNQAYTCHSKWINTLHIQYINVQLQK